MVGLGAALERSVVGLRREAELLAAALRQGCHIVLDGPPGTGKSTLLRAVAAADGRGVQFVEGNAELTPARLIGSHDPALVLDGGYRPEAWSDGPLAAAMRGGELLYLEELNRIPEETLNALITAMAEGELVVPRVGRIPAAEGFVLVAAMNPFDAIGTARVSRAIADRMCRVGVGYLDEAGEQEVVTRDTGADAELVGVAVTVARGTRTHRALRTGSSVRGALDMVRLAGELAAIRECDAPDRETLLDAALAALSGRVEVHEDHARTAEEVIAELLDAALTTPGPDRAARPETPPPPPKPQHPETPPPLPPRRPPPGRGPSSLSAPEVRAAVTDAGRRTIGRAQLHAAHADFSAVSPDVAQVDSQALETVLHRDPDAAVALLADMAVATDPALRAQARQLARRLLPRLAGSDPPRRRGSHRLAVQVGGLEGDLDLDRSLARSHGRRPRHPEELVTRRFGAAPRAVCLLVDRSGSMSGHGVALAAVAAAAVLSAAREQLRCGVIAFASEVMVLREPESGTAPERVIDDLLALRGHGRTDLAAALRAGAHQLRAAPPGGRTALLLSDCLSTRGGDPLPAAGGLDCLHVLGTSADDDAQAAGVALARRGGGRFLRASSVAELTASLPLALR